MNIIAESSNAIKLFFSEKLPLKTIQINTNYNVKYTGIQPKVIASFTEISALHKF
jgi:hypothetical protein